MPFSQIQHDELHLWWVNLRELDSEAHALRRILSPSEQARAEQFRFLRHRNNYVIRHGILRILLACYVGQRPSGLEFTMGARGKPELRSASGEPGIHFNLSHSRDVALLGFARACPIGVDVERLDPVPDCEQIARRFFSQAEAASLAALPGEMRDHRFLELWTCREALLKATGEGLVAGGATPEARPSGPSASGFGGAERAPQVSAEWRIHSFRPLPGYVAAVACPRYNLRIIRRGVPAFARRDSAVPAGPRPA